MPHMAERIGIAAVSRALADPAVRSLLAKIDETLDAIKAGAMDVRAILAPIRRLAERLPALEGLGLLEFIGMLRQAWSDSIPANRTEETT